jgi:hypothetical protein
MAMSPLDVEKREAGVAVDNLRSLRGLSTKRALFASSAEVSDAVALKEPADGWPAVNSSRAAPST